MLKDGDKKQLRYLGSYFSNNSKLSGKCCFDMSVIVVNDYVEKFSTLKLPLIIASKLINSILLPKINTILSNLLISMDILKKFSTTYKTKLCKSLNLPQWTSKRCFYASHNFGGLNITDPISSTCLSLINSLNKKI